MGRVRRMLHVRPTDQLARIRVARRRRGRGAAGGGAFLPHVPRSTDLSARFTVSVTPSVAKPCRYTHISPRGSHDSLQGCFKIHPTESERAGLPPPYYTRFLPALPPSLCMLLRLLMIALDRMRDLTRCEYNTRIYVRTFAEVFFYRDT